MSGGQTKRVSLAIELLANPSLLFLDEVTSGLDEKSDLEMMQLFRRLTDQGKTIVCVTHNLTNVTKNCDLVIILAEGGTVAYLGPPKESLEYFQVERLGDIYEQLSSRSPSYWKDKYLQSTEYNKWVGARIATEPLSDPTTQSKNSTAAPISLRLLLRQTNILLHRYTRLLQSDPKAIATTFTQTLLVSILIILVFGDVSQIGQGMPSIELALTAQRCSKLLFILAISSFWFGCNNSSREIVKERELFLKDQRVGVSCIAYYFSKAIPLWLLSFTQSIFLYGLVSRCCHLPGTGYFGLMALLVMAFSGVVIGLGISALSRTNEMATALVPAVLIPQIILAGGLQPLTGFSEGIAKLTICCHSGLQLLLSTLTPDLFKTIMVQPVHVFEALALLAVQCTIVTAATILMLSPYKLPDLGKRLKAKISRQSSE